MNLVKRLIVVSLFAFVVSTFTGCPKPEAETDIVDTGDYVEPPPPADDVLIKKAEQEAMSLINENHEMRREIFESRAKLGLPQEEIEDPTAKAAAPEATTP